MNEQVTKQRGLGRVKRIEALKTDTLVGDVRDLLLQEARDAKNALPWTARSEKDQADIIDHIDRFSRGLVAKCVNLVAAGDSPAVPVTIKKWQVTDELQIGLTTAATVDNMTTMIDGGSIGFLVFADKEPFAGEREPIKPTPDQGRLLDDDDGAVAEAA